MLLLWLCMNWGAVVPVDLADMMMELVMSVLRSAVSVIACVRAPFPNNTGASIVPDTVRMRDLEIVGARPGLAGATDELSSGITSVMPSGRVASFTHVTT